MKAIIPVRIRPDAQLDRNRCHLSLSNRDEVEWHAPARARATITFGKSPFGRSRRRFVIRPKKTKRSGVPRGKLGRYKYTVVVGGRTNDPDVWIER